MSRFSIREKKKATQTQKCIDNKTVFSIIQSKGGQIMATQITSKDAIREIQKLRGWSQEKLAQESGMKSQSNITGILNRGSSLRVDILTKLVEALGCEIIIRDKQDHTQEWRIHDNSQSSDANNQHHT